MRKVTVILEIVVNDYESNDDLSRELEYLLFNEDNNSIAYVSNQEIYDGVLTDNFVTRLEHGFKSGDLMM